MYQYIKTLNEMCLSNKDFFVKYLIVVHMTYLEQIYVKVFDNVDIDYMIIDNITIN